MTDQRKKILVSSHVGFERLYVDDHEPILAIRLDLEFLVRTGRQGGERSRSSQYVLVEEAEALAHRLLDAVPEAKRRAARKDH